MANRPPTIQMGGGAHTPSRAVVGALAEHCVALGQITVQGSIYTSISTGEAPVETREGACAPRFRLHAYGEVAE